jgi:hypothetical protein
VRVDYFRQSDERVITAFTIQTDNANLVFKDSGGIQQAQLNIFGRITHVSGRRAGIFEDPVITRATAEELTEMKDKKSAYQKAVALRRSYKLDVVRDIESGATGGVNPVVVPKYDNQKLSTSTLILASKLEGLNDQPRRHVYHREREGDPKRLGLFSSRHAGRRLRCRSNSGIDQTTLRPSVDVERMLMKDGKEVGKQTEDWRGNSDSGQRLTLARRLIRGPAPGEYSVQVRIGIASAARRWYRAKFTLLP